MILYSPDLGNTWTRQGEGVAALQGVSFEDVWAIDQNTVWAVGSGNTILKTTDGGSTWTKVQGPAVRPFIELSSISFVGTEKRNKRGFIARTTDGGQNWEEIIPENNYNKHG